MNPESIDGQAAAAIQAAYDAYSDQFLEITLRSRKRFEERDWRAVLKDAMDRLELYKKAVDGAAHAIAGMLGASARQPSQWLRIKQAYSALSAGRYDADLAHTFFNSVGRRFLDVNVVEVTYRDDISARPMDAAVALRQEGTIQKEYPYSGNTRDLIRRILRDYPFDNPYENLERDVDLVADRIESFLRDVLLTQRFDAIHMVRPMFFRNKAVFLIGGLRLGTLVVPLVMVLRHGGGGMVVHAALIEEANAGNLFSNTRSNFHVEVRRHRELIDVLRALLPEKQVYEFYAGIGYYNHARTELYEHLFRHLRTSGESFERAPGARGKVMAVFTLPTFPMVFKVIRDEFEPPKNVTRADVVRKYQFVRTADRAGRMLDALTFGDLRFPRDQFRDELLDELLKTAGGTVQVKGDHVVVSHLYIQAQVAPLPEYLRHTRDLSKRRDAVIDFGYLIKDLATVNIFMGDYLLKNFGVTSYGRVVSFDYDELDLLTHQRFRAWPQSRNDDEELSGSHIESMVIEDTDVFPEEFEKFLGIPGYLMPAFKAHHEDLFSPGWWVDIQERLRRNEVIDISSASVSSLQDSAA